MQIDKCHKKACKNTPVNLKICSTFGRRRGEIKKDDGAVLQFGVWEYKNKKITWSYKINSYIGHDTNPVLSANSEEFKVRENDGTTTTFSKLE